MPPSVKSYPCGCKHNGFAMTPDSSICREHFTTDQRHFCDEWDGLLIDKNSPEFASCLCFGQDKIRQPETERNAP